MTLLGLSSIGVILYSFSQCISNIRNTKKIVHIVHNSHSYNPYFEDHIYFQNHLLHELQENHNLHKKIK